MARDIPRPVKRPSVQSAV